MSHFLLIGNATLDILSDVDHYPHEDEELRALAMRQCRGGNAANSACVLVQQGHRVSFLGVLADDPAAVFLRQDFARFGVDTRYCPISASGHTPVSCITRNRLTGSRTIVHYRELAELSPAEFTRLPLTQFDWFHFEGRNIEALQQMLAHLHTLRVDQPISLEVEKPRPGIEALLPQVDVAIFSRSYAQARGIASGEALLRSLQATAAQTRLVCSWGEQGAYGLDQAGQFFHVPAHATEPIVDSVGAGDTFNAGLLHALNQGRSLPQALQVANRLAAAKLGQAGFDNLVAEAV